MSEPFNDRNAKISPYIVPNLVQAIIDELPRDKEHTFWLTVVQGDTEVLHREWVTLQRDNE